MTYELASQLKEAGFPQIKSDGRNRNGHYIVDGKVPCFDPTLAELIAACGDDFEDLRAPFGEPEDGDFDIDWRAFSNKIDFRTMLYIKIQGAGSTPEEAVANLWIALQKGNHAIS